MRQSVALYLRACYAVSFVLGAVDFFEVAFGFPIQRKYVRLSEYEIKQKRIFAV